MKKLIVFIALLTALIACDKTNDILDTGLTNAQVIEGLKSALTVGTDTAVSIVSKVNGYFLDEAIKIYLPPDADIIVQNASNPLLQAIGIDALINDVVLRMNRAAEDAATEAAPIFINAITSMTIQDAFAILNGSDTAATHYLREKTYTDLKNAFQPKIAVSLDKPLVGGISASDTWTSLTTAYNQVAQFVPGWNTVNTQLDDHVTRKALNGLFIKVGDEEKDIRTDPVARVNDILKKVFGP